MRMRPKIAECRSTVSMSVYCTHMLFASILISIFHLFTLSRSISSLSIPHVRHLKVCAIVHCHCNHDKEKSGFSGLISNQFVFVCHRACRCRWCSCSGITTMALIVKQTLLVLFVIPLTCPRSLNFESLLHLPQICQAVLATEAHTEVEVDCGFVHCGFPLPTTIRHKMYSSDGSNSVLQP